MRIIGLDIGEKRVGIAYCDTATNVCVPLKVINASEVSESSPSWRRLLADYEPDLIVCGLPKTLSGARGKQARRVEELARQIALQAGVELEFEDERLSSSQAKRYLREQGMSEREMRGKLDSVAASLILQSWLDAHASEMTGEQ